MEEHPLMRFTQEEVERAQRRSRRKFQTDMQSNLATAEDNGRAAEKIEIARSALRKKLSIEDVADITGLPREEVERLADSL